MGLALVGYKEMWGVRMCSGVGEGRLDSLFCGAYSNVLEKSVFLLNGESLGKGVNYGVRANYD